MLLHRFSFILVIVIVSCAPNNDKKAEALYVGHCARCHLAPDINSLPRDLWKNNVLPDMAARMGIIDSSNNPYTGLSFKQQEAIMKTGLYSGEATITAEDWRILEDYILENAPESIPAHPAPKSSKKLNQFKLRTINIDSSQGSQITFLDYNDQQELLYLGDLSGNLIQHDLIAKSSVIFGNFVTPVSDFFQKDNDSYVTTMGFLHPSELSSGKIFINTNNPDSNSLPGTLHRPVNSLITDLDQNGNNEIIVSEFGNLTGQLSLWIKNGDNYKKQVLLKQPGVIRSLAHDMDKDGKKDLIVLTSQGDESITVLYQENNLKFRKEKLIQFSPVYGSSWFELVDYDNDGDMDIISVQGDNADKTYISKPYHGLRIHINDGNNNFEEKYFYPLNGATRFVSGDFDQDGDLDMGIIATFPDYENYPNFSFVYLENIDAQHFKFDPYTFDKPELGRWLLIDSGDVDKDGDQDIILGSFTFAFTPVPKQLSQNWNTNDTDVVILENLLK
ncbi:VCBS repeat-containing protein [Antarcticibacterium sp. 1MA-6-2]|uniref:FG-GAP repeat domain-containing protein n=1 Tax=Antarcticibacterium sp. 1MA-6-2 TaxID=2908210 RepID=UPI001F250D0A|nr:VCBS repeat-containing protein [Antarcticibacterium sp. 1MA-6-2]UJH90075.1 VCBS repeat-containing protein [Antarcticibacterium sp. 1MA-6-2]